MGFGNLFAWIIWNKMRNERFLAIHGIERRGSLSVRGCLFTVIIITYT